MSETWRDQVSALSRELGRTPTLGDLLKLAKTHTLTDDERREQAESWARANISTGDPWFD